MSKEIRANLQLRVRIYNDDPELKELFDELSKIDDRYRNKRLIKILKECSKLQRVQLASLSQPLQLTRSTLAPVLRLVPLDLLPAIDKAPATPKVELKL
jgi:hypothetical protein